LLDNDANRSLKNKEGQTALFLAKTKGHSDIVKLLKIKKDFDPNWHSQCSEDLDIISQEKWADLAKEQEPEDPITIRFPGDPGKPDRIECGDRDNFIQSWKSAPTMVPWIPNSETVERRLRNGEPIIDASGHGGIPSSGPKFWKITQYHYVMNPEILESDETNFEALKLIDERILYGNEEGTFGVSEAHGQEKDYIYKLKEI